MINDNKIDDVSAPKNVRKPKSVAKNTDENNIVENSNSSKASTATRAKPTPQRNTKAKNSSVPRSGSKAKTSAKPRTQPKRNTAPKDTDLLNAAVNDDTQIEVSAEIISEMSSPQILEENSLAKKSTKSTTARGRKKTSASTKQTVIEKPILSEEDGSKATKAPKKTPTKPSKTNSNDTQLSNSKKDVDITASNDGNNEVEQAVNITESDESAENTLSKSRRGRRGGRGKRTKQRAIKPLEEAEDSVETTARSKAVQSTSVTEGKPGRARVASGKKSVVTSKRRTMFISVVSGEQVEVVFTEEGAIHEYYLEMQHQVKTKGNIYKGVVHNVDTNLQAAFINYGSGKNGFLQIDEIHPEYYQSHHEPQKGKKYPPIQHVIKPGQEILVQVLKEPTGNKGAFLTTWLSLAGRFLVLTPGQEQIGISRKVDNDEERTRLREMMTGIDPGVGLGVIVRTVSAGTSKTTLKNDLQYLKRVWREIRKRGVNESAPLLVYQEPKLAERAIRDYLADDVHEVWVDNAEMAESLREIVALLFPRKKDLVRVHSDVRQTLWERFAVQRQLEQIYSREVVLPSGGRLVFDQTEALMAIDINSGKISGKGNFASMALKTNIEAAEAIAKHLRLRDIGGQIVIDFIEMRDKSHVREVEKTLRTAMKNDRARHDIGRISSFGLLEVVRQRTASSALAITMESCPHCRGTGMRRNLEWQSLQALREMMRQGLATQNDSFAFETSPELALYLLNRKRQRICDLEKQLNKIIEVRMHDVK